MTALEGSSALAAIVGLIFNWMQVRDAATEDQFQAFLLWLDNHHFQDLRSKIVANGDLERELNQLLREDTKSLSAKLDVISSGVSALCGQIDRLSSVVCVLKSAKNDLSEQALATLKLFDQVGTPRMLLRDPIPEIPDVIVFWPSGQTFKPRDLRFIEDDVAQLVRFDFLRITDYSDGGRPFYSLTREGARFAQQLPEVVPGPART